MNRSRLFLAVAGLAIGFCLGTLVAALSRLDPQPEIGRLRARVAELESDAGSTPPSLQAADHADAAPTPSSPRTSDRAGAPAPAGAAAPPRLTGGTPTSVSLSAEARTRTLAENIRRAARERADAADRIARETVARELARERAQQEDLERGGTMKYLRALKDDFNAPWEMLSDPKRFGALFARRSAGGRIEGPRVTAETDLADGDTLYYPPGRHAVDVDKVFNRRSPFPKDLVVGGAGMDETLLVLSTALNVRSEIHSLTFRDMTIHCNDNYMDKSRRQPFTMRLEGCRVIGFDMGAGGSCMLGGSVGAFYASSCRFEAGFGRTPGFGNLFDVRGMFISRMEHCLVVGPFRSVFRPGHRAAYVFEDCAFTNSNPLLAQAVERARNIQLVDCTFEPLSAEQARARTQTRPLSELNPSWAR